MTRMVVQELARRRNLAALSLTFIVVVVTTIALVGCTDRPQQINAQVLDTVPEKEAYLLDQLERHWQSPDVHCELGRYYHSQGKWDKAEYHFNTALGIKPAHRKTQAAQIKMLTDQGKTHDAEQTIVRYQRQLWNAPIEMVSLGEALAQEDLHSHALACFNKAMSIAPHSAVVNKEIGFYHLRRQNAEQARDYLTRSFELNPNQPDVAGALGRLGVVVEVPTFQAQQQEQEIETERPGT